MSLTTLARNKTKRLKNSLFDVNMHTANIAASIKLALLEMQEGKYTGLDVILSAARCLRMDVPIFWQQIADLFDAAVPEIDWAQPTYIIDGEDRYESFEDFYNRECADWMGPFDHFREVVSKYRQGQIDTDEGTKALQAAALSRREQADQTRQAVADALAAHPDATQEQIAEVVGVDQSTVSRVMHEICANSTPKLLNHGGNHGEQVAYRQVDNKGSNKKDYILARLERDGHAELLAKVRAGNLSAHKAGIDAGFIKPESQLVVAKRAWRKMTSEEQQHFLAWISNA